MSKWITTNQKEYLVHFKNFLISVNEPVSEDVVQEKFLKYLLDNNLFKKDDKVKREKMNMSRPTEFYYEVPLRSLFSSRPQKTIQSLENGFIYEDRCYSIKKNENTILSSIKPYLQIYYGPPGTGKTKKAKEFIQNELKVAPDKYVDRCCIVQIHPSYSYEDLIEGIKPVTYSNGEIKYQVVDGPVKTMAKKALGNPVKLLCMIQAGEIFLPQGTKAKYGFNEVFCSDIIEDIDEASEDDFRSFKNDKISLDEFKENLKSTITSLNNFKDLDSSKPFFAELYFWDKNWGVGNYALILDEINRGHVATILGELIFALSEVYAEDGDLKAVQLQYSHEQFIWPKNLSLIGTLNTADTTTDKIDQAIKRRFEFINVPPLMKKEQWANMHLNILGEDKNIFNFFTEEYKDKIDPRYYPWEILNKINSILSQQKNSRNSLGIVSVKEKLIGHSYFIKYSRLLMVEMSKNNNAVIEHEAFNIFKLIYKREIEPSLLSVFNNSEDQLVNFNNLFEFSKYRPRKASSQDTNDNIEANEEDDDVAA